jgi:hypothetical protein
METGTFFRLKGKETQHRKDYVHTPRTEWGGSKSSRYSTADSVGNHGKMNGFHCDSGP